MAWTRQVFAGYDSLVSYSPEEIREEVDRIRREYADAWWPTAAQHLRAAITSGWRNSFILVDAFLRLGQTTIAHASGRFDRIERMTSSDEAVSI